MWQQIEDTPNDQRLRRIRNKESENLVHTVFERPGSQLEYLPKEQIGPDDNLTFMLYAMYSQAIVKSLYANRCADARGVLDAEKTLEENAERARRVLGPKHPVVAHMLRDLTLLRKLVRELTDPEIQVILQDPKVRQVIQDLSGGDVAAGQRAMSDPVMRGKIEKLIASGVLQKDGDRISGVRIESLKRP